ncbi:DUF262 domain-containing protein [Kouleothrix sp.]|uniref:GmrSD restriction endonuclease domain-containing protein n=1 Tax=Kouleothrix sp. TaxID=2779161 RepID=UPI003919F776
MEDLTIRAILNMVKSGSIRIPTFQRGFVWDADKVAFLMDSIYKGYPIGSLLLWRTKERLKFERKLGPFSLPEPDVDYPVDYILDGQQRVTSIFGVFQTDIPQDIDNDSPWMNIFYDLRAGLNAQESQFVALNPGEADPSRYFPLKTLFDTVAYRKATRDLDDALAEQVDKIQTRFKEARIPHQMISTDDKTTVAIVFERVNRRGVPLDTLQLLTAWTWSQDFHLQQQFDDLTADLKPFGFDDVGEDSNLLLRCCSAVLSRDASIETLITLNGSTVRTRFAEVINGLKGAIDFLRSNLHIFSLDNLPYPYLLVPLSVFFATPGNQQVRMSNDQRSTILRWFWRVCFTKRYNSQPIKTVQADIDSIIKLREGQPTDLGNFSYTPLNADSFRHDLFRVNNVSTKTFVLMLAQSLPRSFISGNAISLQSVLRDYNRNEFHHLFPRSFLKNQGTLPYDPNCLANFSFMSRADNNALGGVAPSIYKAKMPSNMAIVNEILQHDLCPTSLFEDKFEPFIDERAQLLANIGNELMS